MKRICADAGFLIALCDSSDQYFDSAGKYYNDHLIEGENRLLLPWPILYETVRTYTVKKPAAMDVLRRMWDQLNRAGRLSLLDDGPYRDQALQDCFDEPGRRPGRYRALSLADRVVRAMLADSDLMIHAVITFNPGDFADICSKQGLELLA